ncbi:hypothetical protein ACFVAF_39370 [Streptomyces sp. NPDC057596]|uniref:hypothetical protein n=1 Tax=unclassified Streptomyces TaxID=2593676 RepID=UPI00341F8C0F
MSTTQPITSYCPSCRRLRGIRIVGHATVGGTPHNLVRCADRACELIWAIPARPVATAA